MPIVSSFKTHKNSRNLNEAACLKREQELLQILLPLHM